MNSIKKVDIFNINNSTKIQKQIFEYLLIYYYYFFMQIIDERVKNQNYEKINQNVSEKDNVDDLQSKPDLYNILLK